MASRRISIGLPGGLVNPVNYCGNGRMASQRGIWRAAHQTAAIIAARRKIHYTELRTASDLNDNLNFDAWFRTGPATEALAVVATTVDSSSSSATNNPAFTCQTNKTGGGGAVVYDDVFVNRRDTGAYKANNLHVMAQRLAEDTVASGTFDITGNAEYQFRLTLAGSLRLNSLCLFALPARSYDVDLEDLANNATPSTIIPIGSEITDEQMVGLIQSQHEAWKWGGGQLFAFRAHQTYSTTSTSYVNPFDLTTAHGAASQGFPIRPQNMGQYWPAAASAPEDGVVCWAEGSLVGGATQMDVKFVGEQGDIATVNITGTEGSASGTLDTVNNATDKIDVHFKVDAGTGVLSSCGMYWYES